MRSKQATSTTALRSGSLCRVLLSSAVFLLASAACAPDRRISLDELAELETREPEPAPPPPAASLSLSELTPYRIRTGDVLTVKLVGLFEDRYQPTTIEVRVHRDGQINLPVVGPIPIAGMDFAEAEQAILAAHVPRIVKDLAVFIELGRAETTSVLIDGAVAAPGIVRLADNERNVLYAITAAGGLTTASSGVVIHKPIDPQRPPERYNLHEVNDVRRLLAAPPLRSGDTLMVEAAAESAIYVQGLVNRPGPILVPRRAKLSLLRAIAAAGGLPEYLAVKEATLVRRMADGQQVQVRLPLGDVMSGVAPDVDLESGDLLVVPYTTETFVQQWAKANLLLGPFNVGLRYDPLAQYNANRAIDADRNDDGSVSSAIRQSLGSGIPGAVVPPVQATNP